MKKFLVLLCSIALTFAVIGSANATVWFQDDFETSWAGDYAPGWINTAYRHGTPPVGQMMQQSTTSHTGSSGLKLIADSTPQSWMWWAGVEVENLPHWAMAKQYDPYVSVWYYDELWTAGELEKAGQMYAVPDWVNPYINGTEDWTDVQFGARETVHDNYYYVAVGESHPGWQDTGVARSNNWNQLTFQLSSTDGYIHFFINGVEVGTSYRNDYTNLGTAIGLYTRFETPLGDWGTDKPFTIWDDFEIGSTAAVPEPATMLLLGTGLIGLAGERRKAFKK